MITTQTFADLCSTTKKTIIYYDKIGLLEPAVKKGKNRLYKPKQVLTFQKITLLKSFGLSLAKIKKYLHHNRVLKKLFIERDNKLREQKETLEKRIKKIEEFLNNLKKGKLMVVPKIKSVKAYSFYGIDKIGRYVDIAKHQKEIFELVHTLPTKNAGLTIFHKPYYSPHKAHMTTGVVIKEQKPKQINKVKIIHVPVYKAVSYMHIGPYSYLSYIWQFLDKFVLENKLKRHPKFSCREFYRVGSLSMAEADDYITELQIPIL